MLDRATELLYEIQFNRFWSDGCNHGDNAYLFSYISTDIHNGKVIEEKLDVYTFESPVIGQEFCLRFGDSDGAYYSPGNILTNIQITNWEPYRSCLDILKKLGKIKWDLDKLSDKQLKRINFNEPT